MAEYQPKFKPGREITLTTTAAVTAGRVVEVSGNSTVAHASAGSTRVVGVSMFDAAQGDLVAVQSLGVHRLVASGPIAPGAQVAAGANGTVATSVDGSGRIGIAIAGAADGAVALIKLDF